MIKNKESLIPESYITGPEKELANERYRGRNLIGKEENIHD